MAAKPLRLLHAANLRIDCPLSGTGNLHDEIREIVETATLTAFERLITIAIEKDVDALLITGNTFDANYSSLTAEVALRDGFTRLDERHIPVLVTPGETDPISAWLELPRLPSNVTIFTDPDEEPIDLTDRGHLMATFMAVASDTSVEPEELLNILGGRTNRSGERPFVVGLLLPDRATGRQMQSQLIPARFAALDWLVCAAGTETHSLPLTDGHIHAQAAAQGASLAECGPHGATLLEVDTHRKTKKSLITLAPVRWERLTQTIDHSRTRDELLERMLAQLERLAPVKGELLRIVDWQLDRTSGEANGWESDDAANELAEALTELSDHPDGIRYVHRVRAVEPDLTLIEPAHREVLTEYLLALERRAPSGAGVFTKWLADAKVADMLKAGRHERWTEAVVPEEVTDLAQQLGWKWMSAVGKK